MAIIFCQNKPQTDNDQCCDDDSRDQVLKIVPMPSLYSVIIIHSQTTNDTSDRNGDKTCQNTGSQIRTVVAGDDTECYRDREYGVGHR